LSGEEEEEEEEEDWWLLDQVATSSHLVKTIMYGPGKICQKLRYRGKKRSSRLRK
jgi:hypothetical protein